MSDGRLQEFARTLSSRTEAEVHLDEMTRTLYATDASMYQVQPLAVVYPRSAADVQQVVALAAEYELPVLPRGGGSSLAGQAVNAAVVLDFTPHMSAILGFEEEGAVIRVQPGCTLDAVNRAAARYGRMLGPDPASANRATVGGAVANNSTGTHSILYGSMIDHVDSLEVILDDGSCVEFGEQGAEAWQQAMRRSDRYGQIVRELSALVGRNRETIEQDTPPHWRRNNGYRLERLLDRPRNLAQLLCGSEGTLGVVTEARIRLVERPEQEAVGVVHFDDRDTALRAVTAILETEPSAVELFDGVAIEQTRRAPGFAPMLTFLEGAPGALLLTEYYGASAGEVADRLEELGRVATDAGAYAVVPLTAPQEIANAWTVRKEGLGLLMGARGDRKPWAFIEDASVPVEHLAEYVRKLDDFITETKTRAVYYAHASAGCLHIRPFIDTKDPEELRMMEAIAERSAELVIGYGGYVSSEHGDGIVRAWLNERVLGKDLYELNRRVKRIFDPELRLNPHRVVDAPPMTQDLRMGPGYSTRPVEEAFDWSEEGSFAEAVELCNGNGACRKLHTGTMCPSYRATRDEEHTTRGRANALRAALDGRLGPDALGSDRLYEVMDLCVSCKGCKTECPSGVDMGRMKTEWLPKYWEQNRVPLRTRLFAGQPAMARTVSGTPLASLVNWVNARPAIRSMMERTLGISAERELPAFARHPFTKRAVRDVSPEEADVLLFADTFNNFHRPDVLEAALTVLEAAGLTVATSRSNSCCGRPQLSKGFVEEARAQQRAAVADLLPYARAGVPIVGLEPSCILTFVDEAPSLLRTADADLVAERSMLLESYLASEAVISRLRSLEWKEGPHRFLVHGHCHQKAIVGIDDTLASLAVLPGVEAVPLDAGCCGMAGSFGYEAEHLSVSKKMGEWKLAPAVRELSDEVTVVAPGFSCHSQIADLTGREALHPAQVLADALA